MIKLYPQKIYERLAEGQATGSIVAFRQTPFNYENKLVNDHVEVSILSYRRELFINLWLLQIKIVWFSKWPHMEENSE